MFDYMQWILKQTQSKWWLDSLVPAQYEETSKYGVTGLTSNPQLARKALVHDWETYRKDLGYVKDLKGDEKAVALYRYIATKGLRFFEPIWRASHGTDGFVCVQVNPNHAGDAEKMYEEAKHYVSWAPNVSAKLPGTRAGYEVCEQLIAEGIHVTMTVAFSVAQTIAAAEAQRRGAQKAKQKGIAPGYCDAVIMVRRASAFVRDSALDAHISFDPAVIEWAGIAITKRSCEVIREGDYQGTRVLPAGVQGKYMLETFAGEDIAYCMTYDNAVAADQLVSKPHRADANEVDAEILARLKDIPMFNQLYEEEGMKLGEFHNAGVVQRTIGNFMEGGWNALIELQP